MEFYLSAVDAPPGDNPKERLRGAARQIRLAREHGFTGVVVGQHLSTAGANRYPPIAYLSYLAEHAEGMAIGPTTLVLPFFNPVLLAEELAFLDVATGGRLFVGLSAGWNAVEFEIAGVPRSSRNQRFRESVEIIRALWTQDKVDYQGKHFQVEGVTLGLKPVQRPRPPIWLGASATSSAARFADLSDALVLSGHIPLDDQVPILASYQQSRRDQRLAAATEVPIIRNVYVGRDIESAIAESIPYLRSTYSQFADWGLFDDVLKTPRQAAEGFAQQLLQRAIIGGPNEVVAGLTTVHERLGATKILVRCRWEGMPDGLWEDCIRRLGSEVLPRLAHL